MKTITISITVPDGVNVAVSQSGGDDRPFVPRPDPAHPGGECPVHGTEWRMVKGGVSKKTGKPFNSFWVCSTQGCDERPPREQAMTDLSESMPF